MKQRNGFVSNSSSSSFIVAFPKKPKDVAETRRMLFEDEEYFEHPYEEGVKYSTLKVAKTIFNDLEKQKPMSLAKVKEYDEDGEEFFERNKDKEIFYFHYSDNDGEYFCALEHGYVFDKLKHRKTSHH